jgi:hypothetical protein
LPEIQTLETPGKIFVSLDRVLDRAAGGPVWLKDPRVASMVCEVIQQAESPRRLCRLGGYVVMSNHAHLLAQSLQTSAMLTHWVKGASARCANRLLNRTGGRFLAA